MQQGFVQSLPVMDFRLTFRKATLKAPRGAMRSFGAARKNYELVFAPFSYPYPAGMVASVSVAVYSVPLTVPWTIRYPFTRPNSSFVAVIRWVEGAIVRRYRLWDGVGVQHFPLYIGEKIPGAAAIEIWSVPDTTAALAADWILKLGLLELPLSPADRDGTDIIPSVCAPSFAYRDPALMVANCAG